MQLAIQAFELETRAALLENYRHTLVVNWRDQTTPSSIADYAGAINAFKPAALDGILLTKGALREEKIAREALKKARELKLRKLLFRGVAEAPGAPDMPRSCLVLPMSYNPEQSLSTGVLDGIITEMSDFWEEEEEDAEEEEDHEDENEGEDLENVDENTIL